MTDTYLNLGCGAVTLPCERPLHHSLVDADIYTHPDWLNVDKVDTGNADQLVDIFRYPWPWPDNTFGGALLSHIVEHIPHQITLAPVNTYASLALTRLQDGWYAFFAELWRVLKPGAMAHVLAPHGASDGALGDPTHTRYVTPHTFAYFDTHGPFVYAVGSKWELEEQVMYNLTEPYRDLLPGPVDNPEVAEAKRLQLELAMITQRNVVYEFYVRLRAVKDANDTD